MAGLKRMGTAARCSSWIIIAPSQFDARTPSRQLDAAHAVERHVLAAATVSDEHHRAVRGDAQAFEAEELRREAVVVGGVTGAAVAGDRNFAVRPPRGRGLRGSRIRARRCGRHCPMMYRDEWLEPAPAPPRGPTQPTTVRHARIRSLEEIQAGLDLRGRRDGLTFMPEMAPHAGKRFPIAARRSRFQPSNQRCGFLEAHPHQLVRPLPDRLPAPAPELAVSFRDAAHTRGILTEGARPYFHLSGARARPGNLVNAVQAAEWQHS
jgi:hypothetical protein